MPGGNVLRRTPSNPWREWARHTSGGVAIYVALIAAVIFGIVGLAIDASRVMIVRSEAQAAADAAALAGASQLDGTPTAITRANNAIANFVTNSQRFASTGAGNVSLASIRYLSGLPSSDATAIPNTLVTTDPLRARFVEVTTTPLTHLNTFLLAVGADASTTVSTTAIGGGRQMVCRSTPLMICNPAEATASGAPFNIAEWRGRQVRVLSQGSNGAWTPGNFGYLSPEPGVNSTPALNEALASSAGGNICYGPTVDTRPGVANGAGGALNTRFGIYENPFNGNASSSPNYPPDRNVRVMPRDLSFSGPDSRFGNGHWNCLAYWNANFSGSAVARPGQCVADTSGYTRYQMYQYELNNGLRLAPTQNAANARDDRRIIYVAVVNCVGDGPINGNSTNVPSRTFLRVFLTETIPNPGGGNGNGNGNGGGGGNSQTEIVAEIIDVVQVGADDAVLHEIVQLYR